MKFGIVGKKENKEVFKITKELCEWLSQKKVDFLVERELGVKSNINNVADEDDLVSKVDVLIVLGGDGTFLGASRLVHGNGVELLGVNLGGLGFLTEFTQDEIYLILEKVLDGKYETEKRELLRSKLVRNGKVVGEYSALNDLVINNGPVSRVVDLAIYINGEHITTPKADGIIFSTPTGSTAYSLSAGGPIIYPTLPVIVMTPICPHVLTNRPLVVASNTEIKVVVLQDAHNTYVTLDGQIGFPLEKDDEIYLKNSDSHINIIKSPFRDYFSILKTKLMWGERYGSIS